MKTIMRCITLFLFILIHPLYAVDIEYGIINGDKVNMRTEADSSSKIIRQFLPGELVYYMEKNAEKGKVGINEDYWYKVETKDRKQGWVFGKYIDIIDGKTEEGKIKNQIINDSFERVDFQKYKSDSRSETEIYQKVALYKLSDNYYVFKIESLTTSLDWKRKEARADRYILVYMKEKDSVKEVVDTGGDYCFIVDGYIITGTRYGIYSYDPNKWEEYNNRMVYKVKDSLHIRDKLNFNFEDSFKADSYVDFDEKNRIVIMYLRYKKGKPYTIEKYNIEKGCFVKGGDTNKK